MNLKQVKVNQMNYNQSNNVFSKPVLQVSMNIKLLNSYQCKNYISPANLIATYRTQSAALQ